MRMLGCLLLIALVGVACQGSPGGGAQPDIVITSDFPTSAFGAPRLLEQAIRFAVSQQSTVEGYRLGYRPYDYSLGSEQNQLLARENVKRMIADSSVLGMIGPGTSYVTPVELPAANSASLAMISPSATEVCLTQSVAYCKPSLATLRPSGTTTFFRITPRDPLQGQAIADYAFKSSRLHKVAAFNEFGDEGELYIKAFSDQLQKQGGDLVYQQDLRVGTDNFSAFLSHAAALGATAIYAVASADDHACIAAAQMSALMPGAIFLGTDGISLNESCIHEMGAAPPEIWATVPAVDRMTSNDPVVTKRAASFLKAYPSKPPVTPVSPYRLAAYDCARILIESIAIAIHGNGGHIPTRTQVVAALASHRFAGATGTYTFNENGDAVTPMMSVYKVRGGHWELADVYKFGTS